MILPYFASKIKKMEINYFIYGNVEKEGTKTKFAKLSGKLIRYMAINADYVCAESLSVKKEWKGLEGTHHKIIHLYTEVIEKPCFENRECILGMVCRLTPGKHIAESIEAMHRLHKRYPEWKLQIIGSGKQEQECKALIQNLNAEAYIEMLGWVEHSNLQNYTKNWKFLLFPTDTEGMPNSLIEMMGRGIPAITSAVGGIADIIKDGENGIVLPSCSVNSVSNGIERAILLPMENYQIIAQKAYKTIQNDFTLEAAQAAASKYL